MSNKWKLNWVQIKAVPHSYYVGSDRFFVTRRGNSTWWLSDHWKPSSLKRGSLSFSTLKEAKKMAQQVLDYELLEGTPKDPRVALMRAIHHQPNGGADVDVWGRLLDYLDSKFAEINKSVERFADDASRDVERLRRNLRDL